MAPLNSIIRRAQDISASSDFKWTLVRAAPTLGQNTVHIWKISLDHIDRERLAQFYRTLSCQEKNRADGFDSSIQRERFIGSRGFLRNCLSQYIKSRPRQIELFEGNHGKPFVGKCEFKFNLSHSHNMALLAVCRRFQVGVDLEWKGRSIHIEAIASRYFSSQEFRSLMSLPKLRRHDAFLYCWTRKEAFIKALGGSISGMLTKFDVSIGTGDQDALLSVRFEPSIVNRWRIMDVVPGSDYVAALAVDEKIQRIGTFEMSASRN